LKNLYPAFKETLILHYKMDRLMLRREPMDVGFKNADRRGSPAKDAGLLPLDSWELRVRIPLGVWLSFSCECCVLSGRDLFEGPTPCPEDFYGVCVCHGC
jgi:hypothetical protein